MPVQSGNFDVPGRQASSQETAGNYTNRYHTTDDMQQMQPGNAEKGCAKKWGALGILKQTHSIVDQADPFPDVQSRKNNTEEHGGPQKAASLTLVAGFCGVHRAQHRQTAGNEHEGHNHHVENAGIEFEWRGPIAAGGAQIRRGNGPL